MTLLHATNAIKYFELLACLIAFLNFKKFKGTFWQYLPYFFMTVFLMECMGYFLAIHRAYQHNISLYKYVVIPFTFYFYLYLFKHILSKRTHWFLIIGAILFLLSLVLESALLASTHTYFASLSLSVSNVILLVCVLIYYAELLHSDELIAFHRLISFWFATGILVFYLGCLPYFGLYNMLAGKYFKTIFIPYSWVFVVLNYSMYVIFSIGMIWSKKKSSFL